MWLSVIGRSCSILVVISYNTTTISLRAQISSSGKLTLHFKLIGSRGIQARSFVSSPDWITKRRLSAYGTFDSRTPPPHVTPFPTIATTLFHPIRRRKTSHSTHAAAHPPGPLVLVLPVIDLVFPSPFPFPDPAIRQSPPKRACGFSNFDLQQ